jgi:hypothetical protein
MIGAMTRIRFAILILLTFTLTACQGTTSTPLSLTSTGVPSPELTVVPSLSPVPSSAPTETLAPAPRTVDEEFNGSLPYWSFMQIDNGQPFPGPSVDAGYLVFNLTAPNQWAYALYGGQDYQNVRVDAQVEVRAGDGALGIVCRYNEKDGWYEFNIYSDQTYMLLYGQWLAQGVVHYTPLYHGDSEKIKNGANEIGLLCEDSLITPSINGVQMRKWDEQKFGLTGGEVGISASSFDNVPFTSAYDWFKVSEP